MHKTRNTALLPLLALSIAGLATTTQLQAQTYDFSYAAPEGPTLYYTIGANNTVEVSAQYLTYDTLVIPSSVPHNGTTYTVSAIAEQGFSYGSFYEVVFPNSLTIIKDNAFESCYNLRKVDIPSPVQAIGIGAFVGCNELMSVTLPSSLTSIGDVAFEWCYMLPQLDVPTSVQTIGYDAFSQVRMVFYEGGATGSPWGAMCVNGYIEDSLYYRSTAKDSLISAHPEIASANIPNTVVSIGQNAFVDCWNLSQLTLPNSLRTIGGWAFGGCSSLRQLYIPQSVDSIEGAAFPYCGLESISVDPGNTVYDSRNGCNAIVRTSDNTIVTGCQNTVFDPSVTAIGDYAFQGCPGLSSVTVPSTITSIGIAAFAQCSELTSVVLPNTIRNIEIQTFAFNHLLESINLPDSLTKIGDMAFFTCGNLQPVAIPEHVQTIGYEAFVSCYNFTGTLNIPNSVIGIGGGAFAWSGISEVVIGDNTHDLLYEPQIFYGCYNLERVTLGASTDIIGEYTFGDDSLLQHIVVKSTTPPIADSTAFANVPQDVDITVPCASVTAYHNAPVWSDFSNIDGESIFALTVESADATQGQAHIVEAPSCSNMQARIAAEAHEGYRFDRWSDGNTDNPRTLTITQDTLLVAHFLPANNGIASAENGTVSIRTKGNRIYVHGANGLPVSLYNTQGQLLSTAVANTEYTTTVPCTGVYFISIHNQPSRKVVVMP